MVTHEDMISAFYDCRRRKRNTINAVHFEVDFEASILRLTNAINDRTYYPTRSLAFVVTKPRYREVFAADFSDRVVHHYICRRLEPLLERIFSPRAFNCRVGKGTLYGIKMLQSDVRQLSHNYTRSCWVMKIDVSGFFMSIDKELLAGMLDCFLIENYHAPDKDDIRWLTRLVVMHEPEKNCVRRSNLAMWDCLPANKSLFTNGEGLGMPIGNLPSQMFANFLLNDLDWFVETLGIRHHGRYVDDMYLLHEDKDVLLAAVPRIREYMQRYLHLTLHPKKFYLQHFTKGLEFTGAIVRPWRSFVVNRVVFSLTQAVLRLNRAETLEQVWHTVSSINSYLGTLRHHNSYGIRRRVLGMIRKEQFKYFYITDHHCVVRLKKKFTRRAVMIRRVKAGDFWKLSLAEPIALPS